VNKKLYTLGCIALGADERLLWLMADPHVRLVDIRCSRRSCFHSAYRSDVLEGYYGYRYLHMPELSDKNCCVRSLPIVLEDPSIGLLDVLFWVDRGYPVCLLCVCAQVQFCCRLVVADLLVQLCPALQVIHL